MISEQFLRHSLRFRFPGIGKMFSYSITSATQHSKLKHLTLDSYIKLPPGSSFNELKHIFLCFAADNPFCFLGWINLKCMSWMSHLTFYSILRFGELAVNWRTDEMRGKVNIINITCFIFGSVRSSRTHNVSPSLWHNVLAQIFKLFSQPKWTNIAYIFVT